MTDDSPPTDTDYPISHLEDTTGLECPLPLLRLKRAFARLETGDVVRIIATDKGAWLDFSVFCQKHHHEILQQSEQPNDVDSEHTTIYTFDIRKGKVN